jgi:hypothetical protein
MSGGVLLYVDAKSIKRNEAYGSFSAACLELFQSGGKIGNEIFTVFDTHGVPD